jgi:hypothetical protein
MAFIYKENKVTCDHCNNERVANKTLIAMCWFSYKTLRKNKDFWVMLNDGIGEIYCHKCLPKIKKELDRSDIINTYFLLHPSYNKEK